MRALLARAAAVLAVAFGLAFAAQSVALADDGPITVDPDSVVNDAPAINNGFLNDINLSAPITALLDLDDLNLNVLGTLLHHEG
jgi:hypothetical protein